MKPPRGQMSAKAAATILNRAQGMSLAESALRAGYKCGSRNAASSMTTNILRRHMRPGSEFSEVLREHGINMEALAGALRRLMDCTTLARTGPSQTEEVPDNRVQLQTCELLSKLMDVEPVKKIQVEETLTFEQRILGLERCDNT